MDVKGEECFKKSLQVAEHTSKVYGGKVQLYTKTLTQPQVQRLASSTNMSQFGRTFLLVFLEATFHRESGEKVSGGKVKLIKG